MRHALGADQPHLNKEATEFTRQHLSVQERAWLDKHRVIRVGVDGAYAPYSFLDSTGEFTGIAVDFIRQIEQRLGVAFVPVPGLSWPEIVQGAKDRTLDVIATAVETPERNEFLEFTEIYLPTPLVIMSRADDIRFRTVADLKGATVALVEGYSSSKRVLDQAPGIKPQMVKTPLDGLAAVATGEADVYVGVLGINVYLSSKHGFSNLKVAARFDTATNGQRFAIRKDWKPLAAILQKTLDAIGETEKTKIFGNWIALESGPADGAVPNYTDQEIAWLAEQSEITIGINERWPPMDFIDANGEASGIGTDYIRALQARLPVKLVIKPDAWKTIYDDVKDGRLDALMGITPTEARAPYFHFTDPYLTVPHVIFTRSGTPIISSLEALRGKVIALEKGFFLVRLIKEKYPWINVREYDSTLDALYGVSRGEAEGYIGNRAVALYQIDSHLINNLMENTVFSESRSVNAIGVRNDRSILRDILQKTLAQIPDSNQRAILNRWVDPAPADAEALLTPRQKAWFSDHRFLRMGVPANWPPFTIMDENAQYNGMAADVLSLISAMVPAVIDPNTIISEVDMLEKIRRKELDMVASAIKTPEMAEQFAFTRSYLSFPIVILMHKDSAPVADLDGLRRRRIGVVSGRGIANLVEMSRLDGTIVTFEKAADALSALDGGQVDAFVDTVPTINYARQFVDSDDLRVAAPTSFSVDLAFAVRKDLPELVEILDRAIGNLTDLQKRAITQSWLRVKVERRTNWLLLIQITAAVLLITGIIIALITRWNRRLANEIKQRQRAENELKKEIDIKNAFFSIIAHDLRSPFTTLLGMTELMAQLAPTKTKEELASQALNVHDAARRVFALLENLLQWAVHQMEAAGTEPTEVDLGELVKECVGVFEATAAKKGIDLDNTITQISVWSDRDMTRTVLRNLINNALKFTPEGGRVTLSAVAEGDTALITVEDTGVGMPDEVREHVFELVRKTSTMGTAKESGTGLGLPLCADLVTKNGGRIWVESEEGKGTKIFVALPMAETNSMSA